MKLRAQGWLDSSPLEGEPNRPCDLVGGISQQTQTVEHVAPHPPPNHASSAEPNHQHRATRDLAPPQGGSYRAGGTGGISTNSAEAKSCEFKKLPITSITPFTFQDYPEHTACILWFSGCNMQCRYCHNPELVRGELPKLPFKEVRAFLESRRGLLEGVVLSGGECMMSSQLPDFVRYLKSLGYKVKIDTNGTNPEMLGDLLHHHLLDYVALDYKAPSALFEEITQFDGYEAFERSLKLLIASRIGLEVRTTVHADLLEEADINSILGRLYALHYHGNYYIQNFRSGATLGNIGEPIGELNLAAIKAPEGITLHTRGFSKLGEH